MNGFQSGFADKINEMLEFREAIGYKSESHTAYLLKFDVFCREQYPGAAELTETIALAWATTKQVGTVSANQTIRAFGNYLRTMGEDAYVLPDGFQSRKRTFSAYIFTDMELSALFREIDRIITNSRMDVIAPVLFRLNYTSGLRPNESRELLTENVRFDSGEILITKTKKHRERVVVMSDDMLDMCIRYEQQRRLFAGNGPFFFPHPQSAAYTASAIDRLFKSCWAKANPDIPKDELPAVRVYDLRHRFASACLNRWLDQKRDLMVMLPYLRAYMGHLRMNDTAYYIHLLPENLVKSAAIDWDALDDLLPEVPVC